MEVGDDQFGTLSGLATDLVRSNVAVIVTGGTAAAKALKNKTRTIPIVMAIVGDPVAAGLVDRVFPVQVETLPVSALLLRELGTKRLELLKEICAQSDFTIAVLSNAKNPQSKIEMKEMQEGSSGLWDCNFIRPEYQLRAVWMIAFVAMNKAHAQALILLTDPILFSQRKRTVTILPVSISCQPCISIQDLSQRAV